MLQQLMRQHARALIATLLATATYVAPGMTETLHVVADGTGEYPSIQAAVDAAMDGDVIELADGTFGGSGNRDVDYLGKSIVIRSASGHADACIIECGATDGDWHRGFVFQNNETPASVLENVTVRGGLMKGSPALLQNVGGAVLCYVASPTLRGCIFQRNEAIAGGALYASDGSATVEGCLITGNRAQTGGGAKVTLGVGGPYQFVACTLAANNASVTGGGLFAGNFAEVEINRSIIWENCATNPDGDDVLIDLFALVHVACGVIPGQHDGEGDLDVDGNTVSENPQFCDPARCDDAPTSEGTYTVAEDSPAAPENSPCGQLIGARPVGCSATPTRLTSWSWLKGRFASGVLR